MQQQQASPITKFVTRQLRKRKVWVDPRYGTVNRTKAAITIVPPVAAEPEEQSGGPDADHDTGGGRDRPVTPGHVVVVGLGPAGVDLMLPKARSKVSYMAHRYVRTARHPAVDELGRHGLDFESFDERYDTTESFDDLYRRDHERSRRGRGRAR